MAVRIVSIASQALSPSLFTRPRPVIYSRDLLCRRDIQQVIWNFHPESQTQVPFSTNPPGWPILENREWSCHVGIPRSENKHPSSRSGGMELYHKEYHRLWVDSGEESGRCFKQKWRVMPMDAKIRISEKLAVYTLKLRALTFDKIGSLYFKNTYQTGSTQDFQHIKFMSNFLGKDVELGKIVSPFFFVKRRLYIPSDRGPFATSHQYLTAKINLQTAWIKSGLRLQDLRVQVA